MKCGVWSVTSKVWSATSDGVFGEGLIPLVKGGGREGGVVN